MTPWPPTVGAFRRQYPKHSLHSWGRL